MKNSNLNNEYLDDEIDLGELLRTILNSKKLLIFKLQQEKDTLEMHVKLVNDQTYTTQPIRDIVTSEIKTNTLLTILIGTILGFIFSVFIVFIRQAFLKEQN